MSEADEITKGPMLDLLSDPRTRGTVVAAVGPEGQTMSHTVSEEDSEVFVSLAAAVMLEQMAAAKDKSSEWESEQQFLREVVAEVKQKIADGYIEQYVDQPTAGDPQ